MNAQPSVILFSWPFSGGSLPILPVFLPFYGCPTRCIFCAQHIQTGQNGVPHDEVLHRAAERLALRRQRGLGPCELAFFGGTFTAVPAEVQKKCLDFAKTARSNGDIAALRCSTRPDCMSDEIAGGLREAGCTTVELGIQSFDDAALATARRGYDGSTAAEACRTVCRSGLQLGVQLMPGMPGVSPEIFLEDVRRTADSGAAFVRFYPCLVLRGTALETMWREGKYSPWPADATLDALSKAFLIMREAGIQVIRMGLAPEAGLEDAVMAGPVHPALGARVQAQALLLHVRSLLESHKGTRIAALRVPKKAQGFFWGDRGELIEKWAQLGLHGGQNVFFENCEMFSVSLADDQAYA